MSRAEHILVVDDEPQVCALVKRVLGDGGYRVSTAHDGATMGRLVRRADVDLVVLDLRLGPEDGLALLRELRATSRLPVVILTALGDTCDRVRGLESGADDYLPKPFEPPELLARVRSVLRRAGPWTAPAEPEGPDCRRFEGWRLDMRARKLCDPSGAEVDLTTAQFDLLHAFVSNPNRVLSRERLLDLARDRVAMPNDRSIDVHIGHLRRKIEADPRQPLLIKTVYGAGYIFTPTVERA
ncbi:MAG: response regulator [Hyphomicrobiales bacterium]|nr:response regulator [Hyphomicrobiales bacterium]MCP5373164.1 response regulator [Hyphomicrobiales bacterium]